MEQQSDEVAREHIIQEQMSISEKEMEIVTVLGSSVAVTLYDRVKMVGGMVHFLLPVWDGIGFKTLRYGNIATQRLIDGLLQKGSKIENLEAKVVGGATVSENSSPEKLSIGLRNVGIAREVLLENSVEIAGEDIGKSLSRFVIFNSRSGKVDIRYSSKK
jgi:chemotaxis protein CheD